MRWQELFLAIVRCEFKAGYNHLAGWQVSAKGALPIILIAVTVVVISIGQK